MPTWSGLLFQSGCSFDMENVMFFHDYSMIIVIFICVLSGYFMYTCMAFMSFNSYLMESQELETFWTFVPSLILITLAVPSMKVLYFVEETYNPSISMKTLGHQWFWSYENSHLPEEMETFMENSCTTRLLKTSKILSLPSLTPTRNLISSVDVIHSWTIPSLGVKVDAVPGRLNQSFFYSNFNTMVTGQCSEICGANHSFMPIIISFL